VPKTVSNRIGLQPLESEDSPDQYGERGAGLRSFIPTFSDIPIPADVPTPPRKQNFSDAASGFLRGQAENLAGTASLVLNPVESAQGLYQFGKQTIQNPGQAASDLKNYVATGLTGSPYERGKFLGENLGFGKLATKS